MSYWYWQAPWKGVVPSLKGLRVQFPCSPPKDTIKNGCVLFHLKGEEMGIDISTRYGFGIYVEGYHLLNEVLENTEFSDFPDKGIDEINGLNFHTYSDFTGVVVTQNGGHIPNPFEEDCILTIPPSMVDVQPSDSLKRLMEILKENNVSHSPPQFMISSSTF